MQSEVSSNCYTLQYGVDHDSVREGLRTWALYTGPCQTIQLEVCANRAHSQNSPCLATAPFILFRSSKIRFFLKIENF